MNLDLAVHMVVKNDVFYILMAIQSVLPYVRGIYIQDQLSTDGTYEAVTDFMTKQNMGTIVIERVDTGCGDRFDPNYNEPYWRTQALKKTEEYFKTEWLLKCDADEIYSRYFFDKMEILLKKDAPFNCVRVSGERFISSEYLAGQLQDDLCHYERSPDGSLFIDPHTQLWRANHYYYVDNPSFPLSHFHPCLDPDPAPQLWLPGLCNIHLHRTFGPKSISFWEESPWGEKINLDDPCPPRDCPRWYASKTNFGCAAKVSFDWPEYVLTQWAKWSDIW